MSSTSSWGSRTTRRSSKSKPQGALPSQGMLPSGTPCFGPQVSMAGATRKDRCPRMSTSPFGDASFTIHGSLRLRVFLVLALHGSVRKTRPLRRAILMLGATPCGPTYARTRMARHPHTDHSYPHRATHPQPQRHSHQENFSTESTYGKAIDVGQAVSGDRLRFIDKQRRGSLSPPTDHLKPPAQATATQAKRPQATRTQAR